MDLRGQAASTFSICNVYVESIVVVPLLKALHLSNHFVLEPGTDGLGKFCFAFDRQPVSSGQVRHGKVRAGSTHRVALTIAGDAADLIELTIDEEHWL